MIYLLLKKILLTNVGTKRQAHSPACWRVPKLDPNPGIRPNGGVSFEAWHVEVDQYWNLSGIHPAVIMQTMRL